MSHVRVELGQVLFAFACGGSRSRSVEVGSWEFEHSSMRSHKFSRVRKALAAVFIVFAWGVSQMCRVVCGSVSFIHRVRDGFPAFAKEDVWAVYIVLYFEGFRHFYILGAMEFGLRRFLEQFSSQELG